MVNTVRGQFNPHIFNGRAMANTARYTKITLNLAKCLTLMLMFCTFYASGQISDLSVEGEVYPDRVDFRINNQSDENTQVGFVATQDQVFPLIQADTLIYGYGTINITIPVDSAEYHSYVLQVSIGGNLRTTLDMSKMLTIPAKKGKVTFQQSGISARLHFTANQYYEDGNVFIYDLSGRLHAQKNIQVGSNSIQTDLPTGLYLIVMRKGGVSESFKVFIR